MCGIIVFGKKRNKRSYMPNNNICLHKAKMKKDDEFYTQYKDVEKEMQYR